jgi:NAD(P)H-flavin reductase
MNKSLLCELSVNKSVNSELFVLQFNWNGPAPKAGQFFMLKPARTSVFLPRPVSVFEYSAQQGVLKFLIARRGTGTNELSNLQAGEKVQITGPFGNAWADFLPESGKAALVAGGVGAAPLAALAAEKPDFNFHFFAGFKNGFRDKDEENTVLASAVNAKKLVITAEDGINALNGRITDFFFEPESYDVIFGCGPAAMLRALKKKCEGKNVRCFLSIERRMACGVGACLGCIVQTGKGNRLCCKDGPIFDAWEITFDE